MFQSITTIGFGDVVAGSDYYDWCLEESSKDDVDFTFLFWVFIYLLFIIERSTFYHNFDEYIFCMLYIF